MKYDVCLVGGCGHVGLPLALCFAQEGKRVAIFDVNQAAVDKVLSGEMPFFETGAEELLTDALAKDLLHPSANPEVVSQSESVILILGTPLDVHLNPSFSAITRSIKQCIPYFQNGQLIVLRSTVFPGTTEKVARQLKVAGLDVDIAFCPERILEGHALKETYELPQIIATFDDKSMARAKSLFSVFSDDQVELKPLEAELLKLYTNVWRYISFAVANEFHAIANDHGADFYKIRDAMVHNYPRAANLPKAGFAAGPCLFKDTVQLTKYCNDTFFLGQAAMLVNEGQPAYIVECLKAKYPVEDMTIGVLGMTFKANSDDDRWSLSYKLRKMLEFECRQVLIADPFAKDERIIPAEELIDRSDILILGTPHDAYKNLDLKGKPVVDIWNFWGKGGIIE